MHTTAYEDGKDGYIIMHCWGFKPIAPCNISSCNLQLRWGPISYADTYPHLQVIRLLFTNLYSRNVAQ